MGNQLDGTIDFSFSKMTNLSELVMSHNKFEGPLPESIATLKQLKFVQFQGNKFDSFRGLETMQSLHLSAFDSDNKQLDRRYGKVDFSRTRLAETKFSEEDN